ncbi:MAG TPA: methyltransferase dimerization domain-containing protein, partial [Candidatus Dormibacteraeota bacterium]|nr:methyltransferase dimerization domain-containing protein [Candidatus Dormibacteraeota bacterium]
MNTTGTDAAPNPEQILRLGFGFWPSRTLLSAVELGVFSALARAPADLATLQRQLGLHPRAARDFLDALVSLQLLQREAGVYRNSPECELFLDRAKPSYVGGVL